ncbi:MAG: spore photoproduct lyase family protein [Thermodesulfobacteriota bacterium]
MKQTPERIYVEQSIADHPFTKRVLAKLDTAPITYIDDYKTIGELKSFNQRALEDKNSLALATKKGELVKSIGRMESGQFYLFHEIDCKYDCEYCYLQYYFQTKVPVLFVNRDEVLKKIEEILNSYEAPYFHVGEVCDALAFDDITEFSIDIAKLFRNYPNGTVEFRTKSTNVHNLLAIDDPPTNIIPSWTFSPQVVADMIEHKTPLVAERISAAMRCQQQGYTVGVRLDPIIMIPGWDNHYKKLVHDLLSTLEPKQIDYISLGTPKHNKVLLETIKKRFPNSPTILGEMFPSTDGKYKYLKFHRVSIYKNMISWIREFNPDIRIDLSIESDEVKELVFETS